MDQRKEALAWLRQYNLLLRAQSRTPARPDLVALAVERERLAWTRLLSRRGVAYVGAL